MTIVNRRRFLKQTCVTAGAASLSAARYAAAANAPNEKVRVAVMGLRERGKRLASLFAEQPDVHIAALCDIDDAVVALALKVVAEHQDATPLVVKDVRKLLDERSLDALVIAAPNHWHALAAVWACQSGKDVYVEKPASHNIVEGRRMVEAARKYNRIVQHGTQRRASPHWTAAAEYVRSGKLGRVAMARAWIIRPRKNLGRPPDAPVPAGVDYDLWLGPAPQRRFNPNRFHYNWNWFWDYGGGELPNNGVHMLDMARLGLGVDAPTTVVSSGGKLVFDDAQETPDTQVVSYEFPGAVLVWEHRCWSNFGLLNEEGLVRIGGGVIYYGDKGSLVVNDKGWNVTVDGKVVESHSGSEDSQGLIRDFLDCVKSRQKPLADIEIGHLSTTLAHLGNISQRVGRKLSWDAARERFPQDEEASELLGRTYRPPFVMPDRV
jgi:predicted dehydrogenase